MKLSRARNQLNEPVWRLSDSPMGALEALGIIHARMTTMSNSLKFLIGSSNRHGDLQVLRTAAQQLLEAVDVLIAEEQREVLAASGGAPKLKGK